MNVERARALFQEAMPYALVVVALGVAGSAVARYKNAADSCCRPGAACCSPGSPCCAHAEKDRVSQR
ncbi:MAG: hypothetical protein KF850_30985 [Labilithrix sp.]|nr:hypothetical protein [Labilithrix sp.]